MQWKKYFSFELLVYGLIMLGRFFFCYINLFSFPLYNNSINCNIIFSFSSPNEVYIW